MDPGSPSLLDRLRSRLAVRLRARLGRSARVLGRAWVHGGGSITLGDGGVVDGREVPVELHAERGAEIAIGRGVRVGGGTSIEAKTRVTIGDGVVIGRYVKMLDNDFHHMTGDRSRAPRSMPIEVGDGAVLGDRAILLPGARVKAGQVVKEGAVVRGPPQVAASRWRPAPAPPRGLAPRREGEPLVGRAVRMLLADPAETAGVLVALLRARLYFRSRERGPGVRVQGRLRVERGGTIRVGARATLVRGMVPTALVCRPGGTLRIGERAVVNYGVTFDASTSVVVGDRCMIGSFVRLCDQAGGASGAIRVEDDVWLAHGVVIAPGVTIGAGSVVSAGSVVTRDVPPNSFAAGNPARAIALSLAVPSADEAAPAPPSPAPR